MEASNEIIAAGEDGGVDAPASKLTAIEQQIAAAMTQYLNEECNEFRRLSSLQQQGWASPAGDKFFKKRRHRADAATKKNRRGFYNLMRQIAYEIHDHSKAFLISTSNHDAPEILDMCMAPGGFLDVALTKCRYSTALAFTLPPQNGGHEVLLFEKLRSRAETRYADITMLAQDLGVETIPGDHPDAPNFIPRQIERDHLFDLVICDGQVLRTQERLPYREDKEDTRLSTAQLAIGLEHLREAGTMIILLHNLGTYYTSNVIFNFRKFSNVQLFKPTKGHRIMGSFYMIASKVQRQNPLAVEAIEMWKQKWKVNTFGSAEDNINLRLNDLEGVHVLVETFGKELVQMGREIWRMQADALAEAPFIKNRAI